MLKLSDEDLTSKSGNARVTNIFKDMPYALRAYFVCNGNEDEFRSYVSELIESVSSGSGGGDIDLLFYLSMRSYRSPLTAFNAEADKVFKEIDVQLGALCKKLGVKFPGGGSGRYGGRRELTSEQWFHKDFIEAGNILSAAKPVFE